MNKAIFMGRATRDPEIRYTSGANSTCIAKFSLAVDRKYKRDGEPDTDFFNCTAFGKQGEVIEKYVTKGMKLLVTGRVQNDNYEKDGVKHYSVQIVVDDIEFAESKNSQASASNPNPAPQTDANGFSPAIDSDLPFA